MADFSEVHAKDGIIVSTYAKGVKVSTLLAFLTVGFILCDAMKQLVLLSSRGLIMRCYFVVKLAYCSYERW